MAQERERQYQRALEILCPINTNKWNKRERQYPRVIANSCPINTNKWHKRERQYQRVIGNPLSNKYKQMSQEGETISKRDNIKGSLEILCPINTNKWHKRERQYQRVIEILCPINTNKCHKRERQYQRALEILSPINTNKWNKRERQYQRVIGNPLSNKYKQMAQERETISKGHWKSSWSNKYKTNGTRERDNTKGSLEILCPINTNKWHKRETISKGHWTSLSNKYNKSNQIQTNGHGTRERDNIKGSLENPLSNKYKQMAQERETISKGH
ncbi:unnamed protein product [Mytilus edulis]|uniref:Uncharacterized protein n=1 Tax=Mytilus edulis TaxID=6550 RepID=A0A8S3UWA8_MYTED|nr:unnamed protein product [Mytilus edulis]